MFEYLLEYNSENVHIFNRMREVISCDFISVRYSNNYLLHPLKKPLTSRSQPMYLHHGPLLLPEMVHPCPAHQGLCIHQHGRHLRAQHRSWCWHPECQQPPSQTSRAVLMVIIKKEQLNRQNTAICIKYVLALKKKMTKIPLTQGIKKSITERYFLYISSVKERK